MKETFQAGAEMLVADVAHVGRHRGWVVVGRCATNAPRPLLGAVLGELHRSRLSTMVLPLGTSDLTAMAAWVQVATNYVRIDLGDDRPIAYLGAGRGVAAGWLAAAGGDLDGVMGWNARPAGAWWQLPSVGARSLLVVDDEAWWRLLAARAAGWRLSGPVDVVSTSWAHDVGVLSNWFEDRLLVPRAFGLAPARHLGPTGRRVRLASVAAAAALAAVPLSPTTALAAVPDFASGHRLLAAGIGGDGARLLPSTTTTTATGSHVLKAGEIKGDGPRGDPPLTDGIGLRWDVNTNIGFNTSSSASGAVSEASFTHSVAASTLNGGTVNAALNDAFDGYNALCLDVNNVGSQCSTSTMAVYNQNGPASLECSGRQVVLPLKTMGNFQVRRKVFVPSNDGFARWLNIVRNTSASTQTVRLQTSNNLGSDAATRIVTTSDGDATSELTDTWVTTFQNFSGTTSSDVRLGHVLRGNGGPVGLAVNNFVNGDDNPFWRYVFTLAPGQTAIIMNFATGQATKAAAAAQSAALANLTDPNALACMTPAEIGQVLNFPTDTVKPVCVWSRQIGPPKRVDFTVSDAGSGLAKIEVPTAVNLVLPVVIPAFTLGTTSPVSFSAVKNNQSLQSLVAVVITDVHGNQASCT